ncbi:hypothetical protein LEP1GSC150_1275 [Leptospira interrogans serovar Copenhageni str. LT2050]|uniref:Uncharacterized protein n=1 Tax=Leptospira interrogans serovar Copenhageni str. LT2050 TaxID=1001598 RepID=M3G136_LEPIT|nr:hypothetical protein LEP1GSC150_1275 [Leptospira interrogans serovar Copenhageni str. LT2050]
MLLVEEYIRNSWGPTQTKIVEWPLFLKSGDSQIDSFILFFLRSS